MNILRGYRRAIGWACLQAVTWSEECLTVAWRVICNAGKRELAPPQRMETGEALSGKLPLAREWQTVRGGSQEPRTVRRSFVVSLCIGGQNNLADAHPGKVNQLWESFTRGNKTWTQ